LVWASTGGGEFIYIADRGNNRIRKLAVATNAVTTLAGSGAVGYGEGACATAAFNAPRGVAAGSGGDVYILDSGNNRIRKVR
jgi:DNA-binding beta-propeller fold protein YncE